MPICPSCNKRIERGTANKKKIKGTWVHKICPEKRVKRAAERKHLAIKGATH